MKDKNESKQLLFSITRKDLVFQTFKSGGKGGQHQNKTESGVRIIHPASGAVGESRTERHQFQNRKLALQRLVASAKFKVWHARVVNELLGRFGTETIDERVDKEMELHNLKIEVKKGGKWTQVAKLDDEE